MKTAAIVCFCVGAGVLTHQLLVAVLSPANSARPAKQSPLTASSRHDISGYAISGAAAVLVAYLLFASPVITLIGAAVGVVGRSTQLRHARRARHDRALESWPTIIEQCRINSNARGMSLPIALFRAADEAPRELRPAFDEAEAEWQRSLDFERACAALRHQLNDPTTQLVTDTLVVAHQIGGTDVDRRLSDLARDRAIDVAERKDARAKQAGVRFARRFVLIVPLGMAAVGASIGNGREAYTTATGTLWTVVGIALLGACWAWSGVLLRSPSGTLR
jgi:tight adherence protein B